MTYRLAELCILHLCRSSPQAPEENQFRVGRLGRLSCRFVGLNSIVACRVWSVYRDSGANTWRKAWHSQTNRLTAQGSQLRHLQRCGFVSSSRRCDGHWMSEVSFALSVRLSKYPPSLGVSLTRNALPHAPDVGIVHRMHRSICCQREIVNMHHANFLNDSLFNIMKYPQARLHLSPSTSQ